MPRYYGSFPRKTKHLHCFSNKLNEQTLGHVKELLHVNPMYRAAGGYRGYLDAGSGQQQKRAYAANYVRHKFVSPAEVYLRYTDEDGQRKYVRDNSLNERDGRGRRSFWREVDKVFEKRIEMFGAGWESKDWTELLDDIMDEDSEREPPPYLPPLFTTVPLMMKLFYILNK
ncbi:hypothetical protein R3P38DRAFT_2794479 [Favolaschia claudopus]|uniref:Uncharacterized protein n=1 Tax=Favolaschia claudopus TaxID=2862362 RepID=A0AAW0A9T9_9AGAR